jgi:hypothetical protein
MTRNRTLSAFAAILGLTLAFPAAAEDCKGNACDDVVFKYQDGCHTTTNVGERRVKVTRGKYSYLVQRGDTYTLKVDGKCIKGWFGGTTANYEAPAPSTAESGTTLMNEHRAKLEANATREIDALRTRVPQLSDDELSALITFLRKVVPERGESIN